MMEIFMVLGILAGIIALMVYVMYARFKSTSRLYHIYQKILGKLARQPQNPTLEQRARLRGLQYYRMVQSEEYIYSEQHLHIPSTPVVSVENQVEEDIHLAKNQKLAA